MIPSVVVVVGWGLQFTTSLPKERGFLSHRVTPSGPRGDVRRGPDIDPTP